MWPCASIRRTDHTPRPGGHHATAPAIIRPVTPRRPVLPKPQPPTRPPPARLIGDFEFRPEVLQADMRIVQERDRRFHPALRPIAALPDRLRAPLVVTSAGAVNPRLPALCDLSSPSGTPQPRSGRHPKVYGWKSPLPRRFANHRRGRYLSSFGINVWWGIPHV